MPECKFFSDLMFYFGGKSATFAMLNSRHEVDVESMGWNSIPEKIRNQAVQKAGTLKRALPVTVEYEGWAFELVAITIEPDTDWCLLILKRAAGTDEDKTAIAREEARPILHRR